MASPGTRKRKERSRAPKGLERQILKIFTANVKRLMREQATSVNKLADRADLSRGHFSLLVHGKRTPNLLTVAKIAQGLGVEPWELLKPD